MTTIKVSKTTRDKVNKYKELVGLKSMNDCIEDLVNKELDKYCFTRDGYAKIGDTLDIDGVEHVIIDIGEYVFARSEDTVVEFHRKGKIAWGARISGK